MSKGYWNYRIFAQKHKDEWVFTIRGCHYDKKGKIQGWDETPNHPLGVDDVNDLLDNLNHMIGAFDKKVIILEDDEIIEEKHVIYMTERELKGYE